MPAARSAFGPCRSRPVISHSSVSSFPVQSKAFCCHRTSVAPPLSHRCPGALGPVPGPQPAQCKSTRQTEAKCIVSRGRMEAENHLFNASFSSPSREERTSWLFSWKSPLNSGRGNFARCHHPEPLARPFDQRGGQTWKPAKLQISARSMLAMCTRACDKASEAAAPPRKDRLG